MAGDFPFASKIVSPVKCNEKPWDLWVSEIGHLSPRRDDDAAEVKGVGGGGPARPVRHKERRTRYRRSGLNRLKFQAMSLHGLFPQMDNLNAAVCHMCGVIVKCSAAHRHLLDAHTEPEPILPPPAAPTVKSKVPNRSRHKKDPPPIPVDILPVKMEMSPVHTAAAPLSRILFPQPQPEVFLEEAGTSAAVTGELQVCVESGELPVVSIQDTEDLPLGENITDDIFAIMDSEGIQSADDITNAADWKNIIRDIGNMQEINFTQTTDSQSQDIYPPIDTAALAAYALTDADLSSLQFETSPAPAPVVAPIAAPMPTAASTPTVPRPAPAPPTPTARTATRSKTTKTKFNLREYDPNKHCGVVTAENPKPCTRSLTCKAHALSLRRTVEGRAKAFDVLLAEHRAAREPPPVDRLERLERLDLGLNGLAEGELYALAADDAATGVAGVGSGALPSLLLAEAPSATEPPPPALVPADVCWYAACPRPLALCTFNASHAGGAVTLGKKFATVRSNIKSSLSRSQCKAGAANAYYYGQNALTLSKTVHMNASKTNKPEVRKLIVTCSGASGSESKDVQQTLSELFGSGVGGMGGVGGLGAEVRVNGHVSRRGTGKRGLDLAFALDPLLADEKC